MLSTGHRVVAYMTADCAAFLKYYVNQFAHGWTRSFDYVHVISISKCIAVVNIHPCFRDSHERK